MSHLYKAHVPLFSYKKQYIHKFHNLLGSRRLFEQNGFHFIYNSRSPWAQKLAWSLNSAFLWFVPGFARNKAPVKNCFVETRFATVASSSSNDYCAAKTFKTKITITYTKMLYYSAEAIEVSLAAEQTVWRYFPMEAIIKYIQNL